MGDDNDNYHYQCAKGLVCGHNKFYWNNPVNLGFCTIPCKVDTDCAGLSMSGDQCDWYDCDQGHYCYIHSTYSPFVYDYCVPKEKGGQQGSTDYSACDGYATYKCRSGNCGRIGDDAQLQCCPQKSLVADFS